jgi:hypothetical protein
MCLNDGKEKAFLVEILGTNKFKTEIRYRSSTDGLSNQDFHRTSDGLGPTVTLFKIEKNGNCIGGFTSAKWDLLQNYNSKYVSDSTAMLFNLTTR